MPTTPSGSKQFAFDFAVVAVVLSIVELLYIIDITGLMTGGALKLLLRDSGIIIGLGC